MNILAFIVAAFVPNLIGFIWYNPKVLGNIWQKEVNLTFSPEDAAPKRMHKVMLISLVLCFLLAFSIYPSVIHQSGVMSLFQKHAAPDFPKAEDITILYKGTEIAWGGLHRSFGHGMMHGFLLSLGTILAPFAITAMYEKRSFKYVMITYGYWAISMMIMGGILCAWIK